MENDQVMQTDNASQTFNADSNGVTSETERISKSPKDRIALNPVVRLPVKAFQHLVQHGLRATWQKVRLHLRGLDSNKYQPVVISEQIWREQAETIFKNPVKISVLVPLYNTEQAYLTAMIESVLGQSYANWELCLVDASDESHKSVEAVCCEYASRDKRIIYRRLPENEGISGNTNRAADMASGEYFALLDHDDVYTPDALFEIVKAINATSAEIIYTDEDKLTIHGKRQQPFFKPDFSRDLLYSQMYTCHIFVISCRLFFEVNGLDGRFDGSQDYDLMLRLSEITVHITHIPKVLYSWREAPTSTAADSDAKPYAHIKGLQALQSHLSRVYGVDAYATETDYQFVYQARFNTLRHQPLVSIIIPTKDHIDLLDSCTQSIIDKTTYRNYEIIILDNNSSESDSKAWFKNIQSRHRNISVVETPIEFNWSKLNNLGIQYAQGEVFIFLNNDTSVISGNWLELLAENALRHDIGVVGALLLYPDDTIQHAGVVVGMGGWADHVYKGLPFTHFYHFHTSPAVNRNVLAVTGACMAISRKSIEAIGAFDENFIICGSDVEICLRAHLNGLRNLYCSGARLYHLEGKSRDSYIPEIDFEMSRKHYGLFWEQGDPFYNPNLDLNHTTPTVKG